MAITQESMGRNAWKIMGTGTAVGAAGVAVGGHLLDEKIVESHPEWMQLDDGFVLVAGAVIGAILGWFVTLKAGEFVYDRVPRK